MRAEPPAPPPNPVGRGGPQRAGAPPPRTAPPAHAAPTTPTAPQAGAQPPSAAEVARFLQDVARLLTDHGDRETAAEVRAELPRGDDAPATVVVVGEKKRGKSSLINALVEHPGLLPVDADVATSVHLTVVHSPEPSARVVDGRSPGGRAIPLGDIAEYAALDPATQRSRHDDVLHVSVGIPHPLLERGICLMDTPGVGGLLAGHTAITLGAVAEADALIFVVDGSSELTASECAFLKQASGRVATVLFALTQIDLYPQWKDVLDRDVALVREHAPRYQNSPWFPLSSRMRVDALAAAANGRPEIAARRLERSGFRALEHALRTRVADRTNGLRLGNSVHVGVLALDAALSTERMRLNALAGDPELAALVRGERDRLRGMQAGTASWRQGVAGQFKKLEATLIRDFRGLLDAIVTDANTKIATGDKDIAEVLPPELEAAVTGLWLEVQRQMHAGITQIVAGLAKYLDVGREGLMDGATLRARLRRLPPLVQTPKQGKTSGEIAARAAPTTALLSFGAASMHLLAGFALPLVGVGAGLQAVAQLRQSTQEGLRRNRGDAQRHVQSVAKYVAADVSAAIHDTLEGSHAAIVTEVSTRLARRVAEAEEALALHEQALATQAADLDARRTDVKSRLDRLTAMRRHAADLDRRVRSTT